MMKVDKIKEIVNNDFLPTEAKEILIIEVIAQDEKVIPMLMKILEQERKEKKRLLTETNFQLSRAHVAITSPNLNKDGFIQDEIVKFYIENKNIGHCFINIDKLEPKEK